MGRWLTIDCEVHPAAVVEGFVLLLQHQDPALVPALVLRAHWINLEGGLPMQWGSTWRQRGQKTPELTNYGFVVVVLLFKNIFKFFSCNGRLLHFNQHHSFADHHKDPSSVGGLSFFFLQHESCIKCSQSPGAMFFSGHLIQNSAFVSLLKRLKRQNIFFQWVPYVIRIKCNIIQIAASPISPAKAA